MLVNERNERKGKIFFLFLLSLNLLLYAGVEVPICTKPGIQRNPAIWGDKIVWEDNRNGGWDIYMYDLSKQKEVAICTHPADQMYPAIYKDIIVYSDFRNETLDIYMYDLKTGKEERVSNAPGVSETYPAIYGSKIIWVVLGSYKIHMYDITTKEEKIIGKARGDPGRPPSIYGEKVVWMDWRYGDPDISKNPVIYMYDITTQTETHIIPGLNKWSPAIYEDKIVYIDGKTGGGDVYLYDIKSQQQITICTNPEPQFCPAIYGDKVVWQDFRNGNWDIYMYDLKTKQESPICVNNDVQINPNIFGYRVVWEDNRNGGNNTDIYMYALSLPTSLQKSVDKASALIGEELTYTITCKNNSTELVENITISDEIPQNTECVEGSATGDPTYDSQNRKLVWSIPSIGGEAQVSLSFKVKALKEGTASNTAVIVYSGVSERSNEVSTLINAPKFSISKAVDKPSASKGDTLTFTITSKNNDSIAFQNIAITDTIPKNCEYVEGSATGGPSYDASAGKLTWQIVSMNAGEEKQFTFKAKVLGGEKVSNKATLTYGEYSLDSQEVTTTITIPTTNFIEDVNFSFDAGLFLGIYAEEGVSITNFGLKGVEACVGGIMGRGLDFTISNSNNIYALRIGRRSSTGAKIEGSVGKAQAGVVNVTALQQGMTASIINGYNYLFPNPLNDATQSANALSLALSSASSFGYITAPGVGNFVDAITAFYSPIGQYLEETTVGAEYEGKIGLLSVAIGTEGKSKAEISNDVAGAYISGKLERLTKSHPTDWAFQDSFQIALGGSIGIPFCYGKTGQMSFLLGYRANDIQNPSRYFYGATVDEGTTLPYDTLHTIYGYEAECSADLCNRTAQQIQDNIVDAIVSGDYARILPQRIINDALNFENLLAQNANEGEAVWTRSIEEAIQTGIGFQVDIGASLGVGGGIRIGLSGQALTSSYYTTEQGELINGDRVLTQRFNRVQSNYRGASGIANFFIQMTNTTLSNSNFINSLKNAFQSVIQQIQQGVDNAVDWVEGGVNWVVSGVTGIFGASRVLPTAELVGYKLSSPLLFLASKGYSIDFVPYRSSKLVMLSRQPAGEFTGMKYAVNLNIRKADGSYLSEFPANSNTLKITITDEQLVERGFTSTDWESLNIFWYDPNEYAWFQLETKRTRENNRTVLEAKPTKPGTYAGGIASLPPDREAPQITIISPQDGAKTSLTPILSANISDSHLKESSIKFYIDGKEVQPIYRYVDQSQNQFLALPTQSLPQGPHTFKVYAEDDSKNTKDVSITFTVLPPQPQNKISFLSLPFVQTEPLSSLMEYEQSAIWTGTNYDISNNPPLNPFQGFWLKTAQNFNPYIVRPIGYALEADEEVSIPLIKGWNAIGLPWNYQVPISGLNVEKNGVKVPFSQAGNLIGLVLFRWDGTAYKNVGLQQGMENTLYPWYGYWVRVKEDCNLVFPQEPWKISKIQRDLPQKGFSLPIKAVFPDGTTEEVYLGIAEEEISSPFPPSPPYQKLQRRMMLIRNGEPLFLDVRKDSGGQEWNILVKGDATLLFPNLSYIPRGWQVVLRDGNKRYYLKTTSALKVEGEKELRLEMGEGIIAPLLINMLDVQVNRAGVTIIWNVNLDCDVKIAVRSPDGRLIRDLGMRRASSGANSLFWDGKSAEGRNLPAGIYIIELTARDASNQMVKAIKGVILR